MLWAISIKLYYINVVLMSYFFLISDKIKKYFPVLIVKNKAVLQERRLKIEDRLISSKSALAIYSKKWRNYDLLYYFWGKQVWLSTKILITIFLWFQIESLFKSIPSLANPLSWLFLFLSYLFFITTQKSKVILILTYFFGLTSKNL